jgi:hypothetical protein
VSVRDHLIIYQGLYWRPDRCGYTNSLLEAGLYTKEEAERTARNGRGDEPVPLKSAIEKYPPRGNPEVLAALGYYRLSTKPVCDKTGCFLAVPHEHKQWSITLFSNGPLTMSPHLSIVEGCDCIEGITIRCGRYDCVKGPK